MSYISALMIGALIGSFPSAFIILKRTREIDITTAGTGNVGAMNSFEVTKSKWIGLSVLIIDLLKGILSVLIIKQFFDYDFSLLAVSLIGCVYSHCYNPWLKFKGGRGLASAAGGTAIIFPFALVIWSVLWVIFYLMKKNITIANFTASIFSLVIIMTSSSAAIKYAFPKPENVSILILYTLGLMLIIISKHTEPMQEFFGNIKTIKRNNSNGTK
jgi:glycerol-3-phosphate acyltransferase PlsY